MKLLYLVWVFTQGQVVAATSNNEQNGSHICKAREHVHKIPAIYIKQYEVTDIRLHQSYMYIIKRARVCFGS